MLIKSELRQALRPLFEPGTMPSADTVGAWCRAYATYAQKAMAMAGAVVLAAPLVPSSAPGQFYTALDIALRNMWMTAIWVGPGVAAVTAIVPSVIPFLTALAPALGSTFDRELAPTLIAEALHTYTLSIIVSVIPPTGSPIPTPLT